MPHDPQESGLRGLIPSDHEAEDPADRGPPSALPLEGTEPRVSGGSPGCFQRQESADTSAVLQILRTPDEHAPRHPGTHQHFTALCAGDPSCKPAAKASRATGAVGRQDRHQLGGGPSAPQTPVLALTGLPNPRGPKPSKLKPLKSIKICGQETIPPQPSHFPRTGVIPSMEGEANSHSSIFWSRAAATCQTEASLSH